MHLVAFALAAVLLGWTGEVSASPFLATHASISLKSQNNVEVVRWRQRHRNYFWRERHDMESSGRSSIGESNSTASEDVLSDLGRRYHRGRSWSGQAAANREETHGFALSPAHTNCFTPSDVARPDPRRRRGWIDPPPAQ